MFIYNISIKVSHAILKEWLQWQKEEHIPEIMSTKLFTDFRFYRLLEQDETQGVTYVIQYLADTKMNYDLYSRDYAAKVKEKAFLKWGSSVIGFQTLMEAVQ